MPVLLVPAAIVGYKIWQERKKKRELADDDDPLQQETEVVIEALDENGVPAELEKTLSGDGETSTWVSPNTSFSSEDAPTQAAQGNEEENHDRPTLRSMRQFLSRRVAEIQSNDSPGPGLVDCGILKPIAFVKAITPNSPAHDTGLKEGDYILRFGNTTHSAENPLKEIATLVPQAAAEELSINMEVLRQGEGDNEKLTLQLMPRKWDGTGLVGFHIVPC